MDWPASHLVRSSVKSLTYTQEVSKMVIPGPLLEAELELEADEQRCLEESMMNVEMAQDGFYFCEGLLC